MVPSRSRGIDGGVEPVAFFAFNDEIVRETCRVWFAMPGLRDQIN
jgi:hypothetical protein